MTRVSENPELRKPGTIKFRYTKPGDAFVLSGEVYVRLADLSRPGGVAVRVSNWAVHELTDSDQVLLLESRFEHEPL
jgi:hypothetical protein